MAILHKWDDEIAKGFGGAGFAEVAFDAGAAEFEEAGAGGFGGDDGDLDGGTAGGGAEGGVSEDGVGEFDAVHFGHVEVGEDEVDGVLAEDFEGFLAVASLVDGIDGEVSEEDGAFDEATGGGGVINEEDREAHGRDSLESSGLAAGFDKGGAVFDMEVDGTGLGAADGFSFEEEAALPEDFADSGMVTFTDGEDAFIVEDFGAAGEFDMEASGVGAEGGELVKEFGHAGVGEHAGVVAGAVGIEGGGGELVVEEAGAAGDGVKEGDGDAGAEGIGDEDIGGVLGDAGVGNVDDDIHGRGSCQGFW
jgi:hypothetical protein